MLALGGFMASSAVILWAVVSPMGALIFTSLREAGIWVIAFVLLIALGGLLDPFLDGNGLPSCGGPYFFCDEHSRTVEHSSWDAYLLHGPAGEGHEAVAS